MPTPTSPSTALYVLGRGILSMGVWSGTTPPTDPSGYSDVGACNRLELEVTEEKLDHFSRRTETRKKDKIVTLETGYNISFTLDEISVTNLSRFLRGTVGSNKRIYANQSAGAEFAIKFVSDNAVGLNSIWTFWKVRLAPGAVLGLIADEWLGLQFNGEGLADEANHASSPFFDVWVMTTTTTTTQP